MKRLLSAFLLLLSLCAFANDGVYYTSGNMLVPMRENTITVRKEILTITIGKDKRAMVDVYYEFYNPDSTKTVSMAFEAEAPYNAPYDIGKSISHPYIHDFKVVMNDKPLTYKNMLVVSKLENGNNVMPLDLKIWKHEIPKQYEDEETLWPNQLYNAQLDSIIYADFGYMFEATFNHGLNIVHHTYSYDMSISIGYRYSVHYWLIPATRWANGQIDDFTLRIRNENDLDFFIDNDSIFSASPFVYAEGNGTLYPFTDGNYGGHHTLAVAHGKEAVLEWHATNFAPKSNMCLYSIDYFMPWMSPYMAATEGKVVVADDEMKYRYIGNSGDNYLVEAQDYGLIPMSSSRLETYSARNGQGILTIKNEYKSVNIRKEPSTKSAKIATIKNRRGELPVVMKCLGMTEKPDSEWNWWIKVEVNGKVGYVRWDLVTWDSIDTY